ncbi:hypothetical protein DVK00_19185 [Haloarcula sp. Atlit-47R]|nr:hypothetical protein DVK00_19185 [Haloarcula sp. Atlit-47R]
MSWLGETTTSSISDLDRYIGDCRHMTEILKKISTHIELSLHRIDGELAKSNVENSASFGINMVDFLYTTTGLDSSRVIEIQDS